MSSRPWRLSPKSPLPPEKRSPDLCQGRFQNHGSLLRGHRRLRQSSPEIRQGPHGHADAVHANASISQLAASWKCSLAVGIYGTAGSVRWDFQQPNEIIVGRRDQPNQILPPGTAGFSEDIAGYTDNPGGHPEGFPDSHKMHYRAIYQHIASGRKTPVLFTTAADGHYEVKLCEAVLKRSTARKWVTV